MGNTIVNPVLKGFNPDPSIVRVGDDYYIATSTFEWFPGVQIHHSRDLKNWRLITHVLTRSSQLNMIGDPDSGGVWAPCLSYYDGIFYLAFTDVKSHMGGMRDSHNYLVTANDIAGPWSDAIYLNSSGFDPSLFHDNDGRKWVLNMLRDHRTGKNTFAGIVLQEYSAPEQKLIGPVYHIFEGTKLGFTEGPHIYKHNGRYYLMVAEGGTRQGHAVTVARAESLFGPYEVDPAGPMLTAAGKPELELQRSGHASLVETQTGEWYIAHLCGRPLKPSMYCNLGRETAIQSAQWTDDGWIRMTGGGNSPQVTVQAPDLPAYPFPEESDTEHFDREKLSIHFNSLREPLSEDWASTRTRPGFLRLRGRESLNSTHHQSMIARRQQAFTVEAETAVEFSPETFQQLAGLTYYYNTKNHYYLWISFDENIGKCLGVISSDHGQYNEPLQIPAPITGWDRVYLKLKLRFEQLQYYYSADGVNWNTIGPVLDASKISDENVESPIGDYKVDQGFTGAFIGLCAQDLSGQKKYADFDYFRYREFD